MQLTIAATGQALIHGALDLEGSARVRDALAAARELERALMARLLG